MLDTRCHVARASGGDFKRDTTGPWTTGSPPPYRYDCTSRLFATALAAGRRKPRHQSTCAFSALSGGVSLAPSAGTQCWRERVVYWRVIAYPVVGHRPLLVSRGTPIGANNFTCGGHWPWRCIPLTTRSPRVSQNCTRTLLASFAPIVPAPMPARMSVLVPHFSMLGPLPLPPSHFSAQAIVLQYRYTNYSSWRVVC